MKQRVLICTMLLVGLMATQAVAENSVSIYKEEPLPCQYVHRIGIRLNNDVSLKSLTVPLIVRGYWLDDSVTVQLSFDNRLSGTALSDIRESHLFFTEDGNCKSGQAGGFATVDFTDTLPHAVSSSPFGVLFHCATLGSDLLPAGEDSLLDSSGQYLGGSLVMTFVSEYLGGTLDIDTTCTNPANHLMFVDDVNNAFVPTFSPNYSIVDYFCSNHGDLDQDSFITPFDLGIEIDYLFAGGSIAPNLWCAIGVDEGDFNCSGWADVIDLANLIDHLFAGAQGPCDPMFDCWWYCSCQP